MDENKSSSPIEAVRKRLSDSWHSVRNQVQSRWEKLSEEDIQQVEGRLEKLAERISERYGVAREEAERQISEWADKELPVLGRVKRQPSLRWALIFLGLTVVMALFAFTDLLVLLTSAAGVLFWVFLVAFLVLIGVNYALRQKGKG